MMMMMMMNQFSKEVQGRIYCLIGVLAITPDSLIIRELSDLPNDTVMLYKYLLVTATFSVILLAQNRQESLHAFYQLGFLGVLVGVVWGCCNFFFTYAFQTTAIANVLVINAASPFFSTILSYFLLHEIAPIRTIIASIVCFIVIVAVFYSQFGNGIIGVLSAILASFTAALYFVLSRLAYLSTGKEPGL